MNSKELLEKVKKTHEQSLQVLKESEKVLETVTPKQELPIEEEVKEKAHKLVKEAKEKGLVTKYEDFVETDLAKETALTEEEVKAVKEKVEKEKETTKKTTKKTTAKKSTTKKTTTKKKTTKG